MKEPFLKNDCIEQNDVRELILVHEKVQVVDVRSREEYDEKHIPRAINIPLSDLENAISLLDSSCLIVIACGKGGGRSAEGAEKLKHLGFNSVWLCGGTFGWIQSED